MSETDYTQLSIETNRLLLKVLDERYAQLVLDYYIRNKQFLKDWEPVRDLEFYSLSIQQNQLKGELDKISSGQMFRVWIFKKEENPTRIIGTVGLNNIVRGAFQSCHLGYKLDEAEINQGYMTEALRGVIDYSFGELQLHRLEANIIPRNVRSLKVVQKLGFYHEGLAKNFLNINGKWEDHIHMVLRNEAME